MLLPVDVFLDFVSIDKVKCEMKCSCAEFVYLCIYVEDEWQLRRHLWNLCSWQIDNFHDQNFIRTDLLLRLYFFNLLYRFHLAKTFRTQTVFC